MVAKTKLYTLIPAWGSGTAVESNSDYHKKLIQMMKAAHVGYFSYYLKEGEKLPPLTPPVLTGKKS